MDDIFPTIDLIHPFDAKPVPTSLMLPNDHEQPKPFRLQISPVKLDWLNHVVMLPWAVPTRMVGFVHPEAKVGREPFMLHRTCMFIAQYGLQPQGDNQLRVVEGPKIVLPYDLIAPADVRIYECPSAIWLRDQPANAREIFASMLLQIHAPSKIVAPNGPVPQPPR